MTSSAPVELWQLLGQAQAAEATHDWLKAASAYADALVLEPREARLHISRANVLWLADLPFAAVNDYRRALELDRESALAWRGLANTLRDLNRFEEAVEAYDRSARATGPGMDPQITWACSQVRLGLEDYARAFSDAEGRMGLANWDPLAPCPCWGDRPLAELTGEEPLWIWTEQGFGDTFQYLRWVPLLLERLPKLRDVVLVVEPNLVQLLREGLAWLPRPPRILAKEEVALLPQGSVNLHGSLLGLPFALGAPQSSAALPPAAVLRSPLWASPGSPRREAEVEPRRPQVGLVWAAGRKLDDPYTHREYLKRGLPPRALWRLVEGLRACGAEPMTLQFGADATLADALGLDLSQPYLPLDDFARTARVLRGLDLVISVDTSMAHMVGAMGQPGWVLLPWSADPRWLRQRHDCPWYPSLRLFRQPHSGDWDGAIEALLEAFRATGAAGPGCRSNNRTP